MIDITIADVAERAGVSTASVSRYLNNPDIVSQKNGKRISEAIDALEYVPNRIAKALATKHTNTVGLIISDINNVYYPLIIQELENVLEKNGYITFLCTTSNHIDREKKYIANLLEQKVAGMVFIGTRPIEMKFNAHILDLAKKIPVVLVNETSIKGNLCCIGNDEENGSYLATKYLLGLNHSKIGFVTSKVAYRTYISKLNGYKKAMGEKGIEIDNDYIVFCQGEYEKEGYEAIKQLLNLKVPPTAVHTVNDQMAIGAVGALLEEGYKIPQDFSIIGYSNILASATMYPGITTIDQKGSELGRIAANKILEKIDTEENYYEKIIIQPELLERKSCALYIG